MRWIGDVLQPLLAQIDEFGGNRSPKMPPGIGGDADAAVAVDVVRRDDDVPEIDPHAELDAPVL
jgi:hypothetical protein